MASSGSSAVMADSADATAAISAMHLGDGPQQSTKKDCHHNPLLVCDAGCGFPSQRRPRKERIHAVARQVFNFLEWRSTETKTKRGTKTGCSVSFLGSADDVAAIESRVGAQEENAIEYLPDTNLCYYIKDMGSVGDDAVYLSPDAEETLSSSEPPPKIVVVGMLIDRSITAGRSKRRAAHLNMRAAKLPLDELKVKQLASDEPLNVDTVMELMQRWWWECTTQTENIDTDLTREQYSKCFAISAALSMRTQRIRHPNRTFHKQGN